MADSKTKQTGAESLSQLRILRDNVEKTLHRRRAAQKQAQAADSAAEAAQRPKARNADKPRAGSAAARPAAAQAASAAQQSDIVLASYNIHKCVGTDKIFNPQRITEVIAELKADILALQEVDKRFGERSGLLDLADLQRQTGLRPVPIHPLSKQGQGWHGNALFFRQGSVCSIEQIALPGVEPRGALLVDFYLRQGPLRVIAAHFGLLRRSRAAQAEAILAFLKNKQDMPTVLLGDLNEWRIGKNSSLAKLMPFFADMQETPSFPSRFPVLALDRVFSTPHRLVHSLTVHDSALARLASDHLPIKALLHLQPAAG